VPGLSSATAAGLARRMTAGQWRPVEGGLAVVTGRMLGLLPALRAAVLTEGPVTLGLDATGVGVCGRKKRGVAYNHQRQRVGRPHDSKHGAALRHLPADMRRSTPPGWGERCWRPAWPPGCTSSLAPPAARSWKATASAAAKP
jgi:hypothetical protein